MIGQSPRLSVLGICVEARREKKFSVSECLVMTASSTTLRGAVILIVLYGLLHIFSSLYASLIRVGGGGLEGNTGPFTPVSMVDMGRAVVQCRRYCGRKFVADSRGFVCQWEGEHALDDQGCCNVTSLSTLVSPATMCLSLCKKVEGRYWAPYFS